MDLVEGLNGEAHIVVPPRYGRVFQSVILAVHRPALQPFCSRAAVPCPSREAECGRAPIERLVSKVRQPEDTVAREG